MNNFPVFSVRDDILASVLVAERFVTKEQVALAKKERLGIINTLLKNKVITTMNLAQALSKNFECKLINLEKFDIPVEVLATVPHGSAWCYQTVPVRIEDGVITLAMVDPADFDSIDTLAHLLNLWDINIEVAPADQIEALLERYYASGKERGLSQRSIIDYQRQP
ncbi:MAG TPA: hypothetical protein VJI33_03890 [Candidatus Paceibacterota bacterium]